MWPSIEAMKRDLGEAQLNLDYDDDDAVVMAWCSLKSLDPPFDVAARWYAR